MYVYICIYIYRSKNALKSLCEGDEDRQGSSLCRGSVPHSRSLLPHSKSLLTHGRSLLPHTRSLLGSAV